MMIHNIDAMDRYLRSMKDFDHEAIESLDV